MRWNKSKARPPGRYRCAHPYDPITKRAMRLKRKFDITLEEYNTMLTEQDGVCAICKAPPDTRWKRLAVDHDHLTGKIRGLLCMTCNTMLGRLEARLGQTLDYIGIEYESRSEIRFSRN